MTRAAAIALAALLSLARFSAGQDTIVEHVEAERVVVDARVIDNVGNPVLDLAPGDFRVVVEGQSVPIESVEWVSPSALSTPGATAADNEAAGLPASPPGRLIVILFQSDYEWSRLTGLLRMIRQALAFVDTCSPDDRLAVLTFDSHLKLRQDFTNDRNKIKRAIRRSIYADRPPEPQPGEFPSLAAHFDFAAARRSTLPEHALRVIGEALFPLPGSKSLLFFGWGIGNYSPGFGLILDHNYGPAARALTLSRTAVFSLDVTSADFHSLEGGLRALSEDTGGFYVKTHVFPRAAMEKVERALSGHYVIVFSRPAGRRGRHRLDISLSGRRGAVYSRHDYED